MIKLLESQVKLLKKLDTKERLLVAKGMNVSKDKLFELIKQAVDKGPKRLTRVTSCIPLEVLQLHPSCGTSFKPNELGSCSRRTGFPSKKSQ
jgi:hypothetical protein